MGVLLPMDVLFAWRVLERVLEKEGDTIYHLGFKIKAERKAKDLDFKEKWIGGKYSKNLGKINKHKVRNYSQNSWQPEFSCSP